MFLRISVDLGSGKGSRSSVDWGIGRAQVVLDLWVAFQGMWGIVDMLLDWRGDFEGLWGLYNMLDMFWSVSDASRSGQNASVAFQSM